MTPLDNDAKTFSRVTWSEDGTALAALKGIEVEKMRERDNVLIAFADVRAALDDTASAAQPSTLDPAKAAGFPARWVVSDRAALTWSEDNKRVFFGIKEQVPRRRHERGATPTRRQRRRLEYRGRAHPVGADDSRRGRIATSRSARPSSAGGQRSSSSPTRRCASSSVEGRTLGRGPRHARLHPRLQAARRGHLSREHDDRRAHVDAEEPDDRQPRPRHLVRRPAVPYWKDNKFQAYDLDAGATQAARRTARGELHRHRVRSPWPAAVLWHRRLHQRRQVRHRASALRPLAAAARRIGADAISPTGSAPRTRSDSATCAPSRQTPARQTAPHVPAAAGPRRRASRSICRSRSRCRPTANTRRRPASTSSPNGQLKELVYEDAAFNTPVKAQERGEVPLHAPDVRRVPRPARLGSRLQGREEDHRRQSAAGGVPVGPPHALRLQEQGRQTAAGHSGAARRLQGGREAADAGDLLREELAEHASLQRAVVPDRDGIVADGSGHAAATSPCCPTSISAPARRTATCSNASRPRCAR